MLVSEVLEKAAEKISAPEAWCQGLLAADARGRSVTYDSPHACRWCGIGAGLAIADDPFVREGVWEYANLACPPTMPGERVAFAHWQDQPGRTQQEVVQKLREAARLAREQGK